jgi:Excalibur calcium-binding domain
MSKSTKTVALVVGVVVAMCCGIGGISAVASSLFGGSKPSSEQAAATAGPTTPAASVEASAAYVAPSPAASPSSPAPSSPRPTTAKPTPRKTTGSPKPKCDPNYADGCVPIASDVDCAGGSGNGPAYFTGTARVVGTDIYDLDRDNDGIACEKD